MKAEVHWLEGLFDGRRLAIMPRPRGGDWLEGEIRSLKDQGVNVLVSMLTAEENEELGLIEEPAAARAALMTFVSLPVEDRSIPPDDDAILRLADRLLGYLRRRLGVAVHCRAGIGRSAMLVACVLMKMGTTADQAIDLVAAARGCRVPDKDEQRHWIERIHRQGEDELG